MPVWIGDGVVTPDTEVVAVTTAEVEVDFTPSQTYSSACSPEQSVFTAGFQA